MYIRVSDKQKAFMLLDSREADENDEWSILSSPFIVAALYLDIKFDNR